MGVVEVYLKSYPCAGDTELYIYSQHHTYCAPELGRMAAGMLSNGRVFSMECVTLLPVLTRIMKAQPQAIRLYDVGRMEGKLRALRQRVFRDPAMVVDGKKYVGVEQCKQALLGLDRQRY